MFELDGARLVGLGRGGGQVPGAPAGIAVADGEGTVRGETSGHRRRRGRRRPPAHRDQAGLVAFVLAATAGSVTDVAVVVALVAIVAARTARRDADVESGVIAGTAGSLLIWPA
ncbi:hypothetical protein ACQEU3_39035 [Spirillospora sp. CA-253888]